MKVNYLKTIGFRKFKGIFETNIYDITDITGKNRAGKSNVLYAIVNIILGTNLSGDEKACLINSKCDVSYGELHFTDNQNVKHILIRSKHRYDNNKNFVSLDGKPITQKDLIRFYKDKKLFLSIVNPLYFLSKKSSEQKEMVDKYLSDICPDNLMEIVYNKLDKEEQKILEGVPSNIPNYITELNADIKRTENVISTLDGKIEYAQNIVNEEIPETKEFEKEVELSLARQELTFLNTNQDIVNKENQKQIVENLEKEILSKETECRELDASMKTGKKRYLAIKSGESCTCPTCEQTIVDESKNRTIANMKKELVSYYDRKNVLETQLKDLKVNLSVEKCKYHALEGNATIEKNKRISIVEENIKQLENEKLDIEKWNNEIKIKKKTIDNAKADIAKFNEEKKSNFKLIDNLVQAKKIAQKLYISYIEEKMKLAKKYLKDVDIKFYSVLKGTGEIKEDFIITYKNNTLADLSRSETIATALEFANMFNKISKVDFPIFIDDYESCADYHFINKYSKDTQIILSKVEKGNMLKIANHNNLDEATEIKPTIKSYKTLNTNKKDVASIPKAA